MPETLKSPNRRPPFIISGDWAHVWRPRHVKNPVVKWPTAPSPRRERPSPTGSVVAFMRWMHHGLEIMERQSYEQRQRLSKLAAKRVMKKVIR